MSEEQKQKIRDTKSKTKQIAWNKGIPMSSETKQKLSSVLRGRTPPNKGKSLSDDTKEKLRQINLGKKHTKETRQKMKLAQQKRRSND